VDIADLGAVQAGVSAFENEAGPIEILVNNAGWDKAMPFLESTPALWKKVVDINLYGPINMHYAVLPGMVERKRGRVVSIASDAGRVGSSGEAVYSACKGGVIAFTKTLAREHARNNIQLNAVCPARRTPRC
jgi:2-hydroxycyclohexanecarboxyl-CoA dehydrogenase